MHTKLKYTFETMELDDSLIAVPVGEGAHEFHGVIKLNETAALIFQLLKQEITENEIVDALSGEYEAPKNEIAADVHSCLENFRESGVLD